MHKAYLMQLSICIQNYVVFVLEHGGNLESFVLLNFDEARSLLVHIKLCIISSILEVIPGCLIFY